MADEIQVSATFKLTKGNHKVPTLGSGVTSINQTGVGGGGPGVISAITTSNGTAIDTSGLTTHGWGRFTNLDSTNYVQLGVVSGGNFYPVGRLKPNEPAAQFRVEPGVALYVKANTSACKVLCQVWED